MGLQKTCAHIFISKIFINIINTGKANAHGWRNLINFNKQFRGPRRALNESTPTMSIKMWCCSLKLLLMEGIYVKIFVYFNPLVDFIIILAFNLLYTHKHNDTHTHTHTRAFYRFQQRHNKENDDDQRYLNGVMVIYSFLVCWL